MSVEKAVNVTSNTGDPLNNPQEPSSNVVESHKYYCLLVFFTATSSPMASLRDDCNALNYKCSDE